MYLFGFPEGLAGGSKETEYLSNWDTSHTTNYTYTNWNSSWNTTRTTTSNTAKTRNAYTVGYHWTPHYIQNKYHLSIMGSGQLTIRFPYWTTTGTKPAEGSKVSSGHDGVLFHWGSASGSYSSRGNTSAPLATPSGGGAANDNVGITINAWGYNSSVKLRVKIGNPVSVYSTNWHYSVSIAESVDDKYFSVDPFSGTPVPYTGSTSWSTVLNQTSAPTSLSTTHGTTYQTNQLTSHITYG